MTTTKEFKTLHGLSDSAFNRLSNRIKAEYPDQELTRRINSRDWKIIDVALFEQYLSYQRPQALPQAIDPQVETKAIVIPHSSIQVLNPEQAMQLDQLASVAESMQVYKPSQVDLNGSQAEILEMLTLAAGKVQTINQTNDEREQALNERKQRLETAQNVLSHFAQVAKGSEVRASQINDEAKTVDTVESDVKKQLAALLASLS